MTHIATKQGEKVSFPHQKSSVLEATMGQTKLVLIFFFTVVPCILILFYLPTDAQ